MRVSLNVDFLNIAVDRAKQQSSVNPRVAQFFEVGLGELRIVQRSRRQQHI